LCTFLISVMPTTCPAHFSSSLIYHPNNNWRREKLKICSLYNFISFLLGSNIYLSTLFSDTLNLCSFLRVRNQVSRRYKQTTDKITVPYGRGEVKIFWIER
jgi:hypothetical protein